MWQCKNTFLFFLTLITSVLIISLTLSSSLHAYLASYELCNSPPFFNVQWGFLCCLLCIVLYLFACCADIDCQYCMLFSTVLCSIDVQYNNVHIHVYQFLSEELQSCIQTLINYLCMYCLHQHYIICVTMVCQLFIAKFDCIMLCSIVSYSSNLSNVVLYPTVMCIYVKNHSSYSLT